MLYSNKLTAIGNYRGDSVFYDEEKEVFYLVDQKHEKRTLSNTVLAGLILASLPLIRWLDDSFKVDNIVFRVILLGISSLFMVFWASHYLKQRYLRLQLERLYFSDVEFRSFIIQEEKNARIALSVLYALFLIIFISGIVYLITSIFLFLFLTAISLFPLTLFLLIKPWKRRSIIWKLSKVYK